MQQDFEITVLGTGSASPTKHRHPSAQFVRIGGEYILLDCGEGTVKQLATYGLRWHRLKVVCITHLHGDHYYGLPGLLTTLSLHGRTEPLTLIGPPELSEFMKLVLALGDGELVFPVEYVAVNFESPEEVFSNTFCKIKTVPLNHRIPTVGYVISENRPPRKINVDACKIKHIPVSQYEQLKLGNDATNEFGVVFSNHELTLEAAPSKRYAYITDTMKKPDICEHILGVDLLYHESTFLENMRERAVETHHSTAKQAGEIATLAKVKRLMLGHFSARYSDLNFMQEEAQTEFENTVIAEEGKTYIL